MNKGGRFILLLIILALSVGALYRTFQWYYMIPQDEQELLKLSEDELDIQPSEIKLRVQELKTIRKRALALGLDLQGGVSIIIQVNEDDLRAQLLDKYNYDEAQVDSVYEQEKADALTRALEVLKNRMDQFGVSEPSIRQTFDGRISIELPGLDNPQLIREALSKVGRLEFHLVDEETMAKLQNLALPMYQGALVSRESLPADFVLPEDSDWYSYWENDEYGFPKMKGWFILKKVVEMDGTSVANARADTGQRGYVVPFQLDERGTDIFSELTGANIGKRLAIVLDGKVKSAPNIQTEINGSGEITGSFTFDEAIFLANVLKAGSLPVKLDIVEERVIGPSLGRDSIEKGFKAFLIGTAAVILFMIIWYKVSGLVAVIGLAFNMFFLVALLGFVNATLTLSGIAGIALTVGMAVDANVLIYERIREEMKRSRSYKHALENGYHMASKTIWDANLTTLIASLALYVYGTGSIKGFGITLTFGIISNIFAALFVTRLIFDWLLDTFKLKKISV